MMNADREMNDIEQMREAMRDQEKRLSVCVHEAGHVLYARRVMPNVEVNYHGPLEHPDRPGEFGLAGVQMTFPPPGITADIRTIARWHCAGSVVKRILAPHYLKAGLRRSISTSCCAAFQISSASRIDTP